VVDSYLEQYPDFSEHSSDVTGNSVEDSQDTQDNDPVMLARRMQRLGHASLAAMSSGISTETRMMRK
jgi:hypothetical protein